MAQPPARGPSVLIVAESRSFTMLVEQMLHAIGVADTTRIDEAETAQLWLRANTVDVVLVDSEMTKASGLRLASRLRCDAAQPNRCVPLILMSAKGDAALMRQAMKAGFDSVVPKPMRRTHLRGELKRVLERPRVYIRLPSGYCGPDRRRRVMNDHEGPERRHAGSFQLFTRDGPLSLQALETLVTDHAEAPDTRDIDVLLVRGRRIIAGYRLDSHAPLSQACG